MSDLLERKVVIGKNGRQKIPESVLLPLAKKMHRELKCNPDGWVVYALETLRSQCGPEFAGVPLDDLRVQLVRARQSGKLGKLSEQIGSSPLPADYESPESGFFTVKMSPRYKAYMESNEWKAFANRVREFWGNRCAVCYRAGPLEVHHRTYVRLGHELPTDCIAVCKRCHARCDDRRRREATNAEAAR
jgi:hypothetical protein